MGQRQSTPQSSDDNSNHNVNHNRRGRVDRPTSRSSSNIPPHDNIPYRRASNNSRIGSRSNQRSSRQQQQQQEHEFLEASATAAANEQRAWRRWRRERLREASDSNTSTNNQRMNNFISTVTEAIDAAAAVNSNMSSRRHSRGTRTAAQMTTAATAASDSTNASARTTSEATMSPFSRMLAQVITEAVVTSFRNGHLTTIPPVSTAQGQQRSNDDSNSSSGSSSISVSDSTQDMDIDTASTAPQPPPHTRQQLTMHISPEMFRQMEPEGTEDTFMRLLRLPVFVSNAATTGTTATGHSDETAGPHITTTTNSSRTSTAVNADGQAPTLTEENSEISHIMMLPVFLYGSRTNFEGNNSSRDTDAASTSTAEGSNRRYSMRIREREEREQQSRTAAAATDQRHSRTRRRSSGTGGINGQWTVYIISGTSIENLFTAGDGDHNFSYEELLELAAMIGPARRPTVSQEEIDAAIPIVKYTQQVKQMMVGNSEGCQVCLNTYQSEEDVRVLSCHHGFHKDCIDKWLTEGQNQCPLCRGVPVQRQQSQDEDSQQQRTQEGDDAH